jgi:predicted nucleic acid-binding Zn ribbon protein
MEVWAKFSDPPPEACEACDANDLKKMVSRTAFKLEGGGWYAEGYGRSSGSAGNANSSDSAGSESSSEPAGSESSSESAGSESSGDSDD